MERLIRKHDATERRFVEAFVFLWREIPRDPVLSAHFLPKGDLSSVALLLNETSVEYAARMLVMLYGEERPRLDARMRERAELLTRLLFTFVLAPSGLAASEAKLRATLRRWIVPLVT